MTAATTTPPAGPLPPIDEQLAAVRAGAAAVQALAAADPDGKSAAAGALLRAAAGRLADAVADLDALLVGGNHLPHAWREPSEATPHDRLLWLARRIWSRARDGAPAVVRLLQIDPCRGDDDALGDWRADPPGWLAVCELAPRATYGATPDEALRVLVSYGLWLATRLHGAADAVVARVAAGLADLGLARAHDLMFEPPPPACWPGDAGAAARALLAKIESPP